MARLTAQNVETIPYGPLGIIAMPAVKLSQTRLINILFSGERIRRLSTRAPLLSTAIKEKHTK